MNIKFIGNLPVDPACLLQALFESIHEIWMFVLTHIRLFNVRPVGHLMEEVFCQYISISLI